MRTIFEILRCIWRFAFLPLAASADDRIAAYRQYQRHVLVGEQMRQRQTAGSLLLRLNRAARRQERINAVTLPEFHELQRRKWERGFNYWMLFKRVTFWLAIGYASTQFEALLKEFSPGAYFFWMEGCRAVCEAIDSFWNVLLQAIPK